MTRSTFRALCLPFVLGLLSGLATCDGSSPATAPSGPVIHVAVQGNLLGATSTQVIVLLNQQPPTAIPSIAIPLETTSLPMSKTLDLSFDPAAQLVGELIVAVGLFDADHCLLATGEVSATLAGDAPLLQIPVTRVEPQLVAPCSTTLPIVVAMSPGHSTTLGSARATVSGFGFLPGVVMTINDVAATMLGWQSTLTMTATLPPTPGKRGVATVTIQNAHDEPVVRHDLLQLELSKIQFGAPKVLDDIQTPSCPPDRVAVADINGDSYPDLITTGSYCGAAKLSVHWNRGDGSFGSTLSEYPTPANAAGLIAGKLDSDGYGDVAVVSSGDMATPPKVLIYSGTAGSTLAQPAAEFTLTTGFQVRDLTTGQVAGDARPDLIISGADMHDPGAGFYKFLRNTDLGFVSEADRKILLLPCRTVVASLNPGEMPSLISIGCQGSMYITPNIGGVLGAAAYYANGAGGPRALVATDLNGDQRIDIAVANYDAKNALIYLHQANARTTPELLLPVPYAVPSSPAGVASADLDFDDFPELVVANRGAPASVSVFFNRGDGTFAEQKTLNLPLEQAGADANDVALVDVNHDGLLDIVLATSGASRMTIILNKSQ